MALGTNVLPIVSSQPASNTGGCSSGCGSIDDEEARRLSELRDELSAIVARGRQNRGDTSPPLKPVAAPAPREASLSLYRPIPLVAELAHREVDGKHVWVGVLEGSLAVLDDSEHKLFQRLNDGEVPGQLRDELASARGISAADAWTSVASVIGRVATAGLVRGIQGNHDRKIPTPERFTRFHLTKACQLECTHCYADSSPHIDRSDELSTERWLKLLHDFADNGGEQVLYTGGEALIHRGCIELMHATKERGMKVTLFTNGIQVPRYAQDIKETADQVQVSLDGPDAPMNDEVRGPGTYKKILRAIDLLAEQGTPTRIGMTIVPARWKTWKTRFLEFAERYAQVPHIEFRLNYGIMQYGRGVNIDATETEDPEKVDQFLDRINGREGAKITRVRTGCGYGEQLVVGPDGTVYPCHLLDGKVCHVDDYQLPEIIETLRGLIRQTDVDHVEGCSTCEIRYLCGGSCRVLGAQQTGSRLITACTPELKAQKYRNMVKTYASA